MGDGTFFAYKQSRLRRKTTKETNSERYNKGSAIKSPKKLPVI